MWSSWNTQLTSIDVLIHEEEGPEREALMIKGRQADSILCKRVWPQSKGKPIKYTHKLIHA